MVSGRTTLWLASCWCGPVPVLHPCCDMLGLRAEPAMWRHRPDLWNCGCKAAPPFLSPPDFVDTSPKGKGRALRKVSVVRCPALSRQSLLLPDTEWNQHVCSPGHNPEAPTCQAPGSHTYPGIVLLGHSPSSRGFGVMVWSRPLVCGDWRWAVEKPHWCPDSLQGIRAALLGLVRCWPPWEDARLPH